MELSESAAQVMSPCCQASNHSGLIHIMASLALYRADNAEIASASGQCKPRGSGGNTADLESSRQVHSPAGKLRRDHLPSTFLSL
mmetsp:Transcript_21503/g.39435  ORF Transcript_21503/g.39435 Transcript_21503/m.39435 type:complete len:85 (+) Transcript_21503:25-279(+)